MKRDLMTFLKDRRIFFRWDGNKSRHFISRADRRNEHRLAERKVKKK